MLAFYSTKDIVHEKELDFIVFWRLYRSLITGFVQTCLIPEVIVPYLLNTYVVKYVEI
jgi:hypothetical protein